MNVYIVTCGEYSDYCIDKVFTSYEKAEQYVALQNRNPDAYRDAWNIECYSTSDDTLEGEIKVYYLYVFSIRKDRIRLDETMVVGYPKKEFRRYRYYEDGLVYVFMLTLEEKNEEKALKIAQDEYAKLRATEF